MKILAFVICLAVILDLVFAASVAKSDSKDVAGKVIKKTTSTSSSSRTSSSRKSSTTTTTKIIPEGSPLLATGSVKASPCSTSATTADAQGAASAAVAALQTVSATFPKKS